MVSVRTFSVIHVWLLFLNLQITRPDIRPHIKLAVSLVIAYMVTLIFLWGFCGYLWVNILTLSPPGLGQGSRQGGKKTWSRLKFVFTIFSFIFRRTIFEKMLKKFISANIVPQKLGLVGCIWILINSVCKEAALEHRIGSVLCSSLIRMKTQN